MDRKGVVNGLGCPGGGGGGGSSSIKPKSPSKDPVSFVSSVTFRCTRSATVLASDVMVRPRNESPPWPAGRLVFGDGPKNPHEGMPGQAGESLPTHRSVLNWMPEPTPKPAASGPSADSAPDPQFVAERRNPGPNRPSLRAIISA